MGKKDQKSINHNRVLFSFSNFYSSKGMLSALRYEFVMCKTRGALFIFIKYIDLFAIHTDIDKVWLFLRNFTWYNVSELNLPLIWIINFFMHIHISLHFVTCTQIFAWKERKIFVLAKLHFSFCSSKRRCCLSIL